MLTPDQLSLNIRLLRGLAALGQRMTVHQQAQRLQIGKVVIATLTSPSTIYLDTTQRTLYLAEIKLFCPELFN